MSYHIVNIDSPTAFISCKRGQLTCRSDKTSTPRSIPLEDVAAIVVTSFSGTITSNLLVEAAKQGVALIICERFEPVSLLLPANRSSDTLLMKAALELNKRSKETLWRKTIDAKCKNQFSIAAASNPDHEKLEQFGRLAQSKQIHKESTCARYYWKIIGEYVKDENFKRETQGGDGLNALLNFGYAVLLSIVLQKLFAVGLDPTLGIGHAVRERSAPLAYDIMEPFRPCVDARVLQWVKEKNTEDYLKITPAFRKWITGFVLEEIGYFDLELELHHCVASVVRSFRKAVLNQNTREYKPWIGENSKWVGCSSLLTYQ